MRGTVAGALRGDGYDVVEAVSGFELLEEISPALLSDDPSQGPDAIIMDVWVPGIMGLSILGGLRDAHWPTPIVLIAGSREHAVREISLRLGADAVFERPFEIDDLRTFLLNTVPGTLRGPSGVYLAA